MPSVVLRLLEAVDGARWVRWDKRTHRLMVWCGGETVAVHAESGERIDTWLCEPTLAGAEVAADERLDAGY